MKRLLIHGDPGARKDSVIVHDGQEYVCFSVSRNGDYHGPERPQLWCVIGQKDEREVFEKQQYIPHFLDTESADASAIEIRS